MESEICRQGGRARLLTFVNVGTHYVKIFMIIIYYNSVICWNDGGSKDCTDNKMSVY